jgi:hypothetical protein
MKIALMAALTLSCTLAPMTGNAANVAPGWERANDFPGGFVYVQEKTKVSSGAVRKAWFMFNWLSPQHNNIVRDTYQSAQMMVYFDCVHHTMQGASARYFKHTVLVGPEVEVIGIPLAPSRDSIEKPQFDFEPGSAYEAAFNYICKT